mgnify:CR=1 FL=1
MGAYDRDYWKEPNHIKPQKIKNDNDIENKTFLIQEYNKRVPILKRYYKLSDIILIILFIIIVIIFIAIFITM